MVTDKGVRSGKGLIRICYELMGSLWEKKDTFSPNCFRDQDIAVVINDEMAEGGIGGTWPTIFGELVLEA